MEELKCYVDTLFRKYQNTPKNQDLKEEILSNLTAKYSDLLTQGLDHSAALKKAKSSITTIDMFMEENTYVYKNQYKLEVIQYALFYLLGAWIVSSPFQILYTGFSISSMLLGVILLIGIVYLFLRKKKSMEYENATCCLNCSFIHKLGKAVWILWSAFILFELVKVTGIHFASNLWFHRKVVIDGPYSFFIIILDYVAPLFTIVIPLIMSKSCKLIRKHEVIS